MGLTLLKSYIEPKLSAIPTVYTNELKVLYKYEFGAEGGCSSCGALWIKQLVGRLELSNYEVVLNYPLVQLRIIGGEPNDLLTVEQYINLPKNVQAEIKFEPEVETSDKLNLKDDVATKFTTKSSKPFAKRV